MIASPHAHLIRPHRRPRSRAAARGVGVGPYRARVRARDGLPRLSAPAPSEIGWVGSGVGGLNTAPLFESRGAKRRSLAAVELEESAPARMCRPHPNPMVSQAADVSLKSHWRAAVLLRANRYGSRARAASTNPQTLRVALSTRTRHGIAGGTGPRADLRRARTLPVLRSTCEDHGREASCPHRAAIRRLRGSLAVDAPLPGLGGQS